MSDAPVPKLLTLDAAVARREQLRAKGKKLVLTNGVFDLLHPGHEHYLREARKLGDALFIALNSDASTKLLKGPSRPVEDQTRRAQVLGRLPEVDAIVIFDGKRLDAEIAALRPDTYCKAGDYTLDKLDPAERKALQDVGAAIKFMPFLPGFSTTKKIEELKLGRQP